MAGNGPSCRGRRQVAHTVAAGMITIFITLAVWPNLASLVPPCPIHAYLGLLCPGCGATHAVLALLRGHVQDALQFNAVVVLLLPVALWFAARCYWNEVSSRSFDGPKVPAAAVYSLLAAGCVFGIVRNLA